MFLTLKEVFYNFIIIIKKNKAAFYKKLIELCQLEKKQIRIKYFINELVKEDLKTINSDEQKTFKELIEILNIRYESNKISINALKEEIQEKFKKEVKSELEQDIDKLLKK